MIGKYKFPEVGVCGLSCCLCPGYVMKTKSRCPGCKTDWRLAGPCSLLHCAVKRKVEFCGFCVENKTCEKWRKHRLTGKQFDSFKCYQKLEEDIGFIQKYGLDKFREAQKTREKLLWEMLDEFNEGRSKSYYCLAATIFEPEEIKQALAQAREKSAGLDLKAKAKLLHSFLDEIALKRNYCFKLRQKTN